MRAFQDLFNHLDQITGTKAKVQALVDHFQEVDQEQAAWALTLLLGKRRRRLITGRRLRDILRDRGGLPDWLIDDCYGQVGDSAETISLLWPAVQERVAASDPGLPSGEGDMPLSWWMDTLLPAISTRSDDDQANAVIWLWHRTPLDQHLIVNKLLTGGFRVGVSTGLISRAIAEAFGLEESLVVQRLMGGFEPSAERFAQLTASATADEHRSRGTPYPFYLASPLEPERLQETSANDWQLEWKWDGIRGQLIHRGSGVYLWSRGEELVNESFPELVEVAKALPSGSVLDGELICWRQDAATPLGFDQLQRRLGRKTVGTTLKRDCPMRFIAYDLLEHQGVDIRQQGLRQRQQQLAELLDNIKHPEAWRLQQSPSWSIDSWEDLEAQRNQARQHNAEGLMLKRAESPYLSGRKRGNWWKHKLEPMTLDAVLLYAQAGSGRRANLFTDYTFGLWTNTERPQLVTFAKAYSGLNDAEILELDRWIRRNTLQRFGPARSLKSELVFEIGFEGIHPSKRHKSGIAVRFPRILRWRRDKPADEADSLQTAMALIENR
ncbi:ATP-dependent DNA ligase [Synechococcus sp. KORDI-52]|uniref:ATP-dependent DNA ligase n=1 Tax=Synechococcus sp. KORDI-52 TaxID=585425 RepID=UPI0004E09D0A|nr:ATP-dependent DNA ligase [Synechococcus sp. KORDI-52]AII49301.1 ATP-dependent DNA ligase [Synechococcus sp. KORDI-52]